MEPLEVKAASEAVIRRLGGGVCDWLPWLERSGPRDSASAADRALVLHAMLQLHFGAPTAMIAAWINRSGLTHALSKRERQILSGGGGAIPERDSADLYWYMEALWALVWAGQLVKDLPIDHPVGEELVSLLPNLQLDQDGAAFRHSFRLRSRAELYSMLDLYYRAHWYARDGQLGGYATGAFNPDIIMERRKALEWLNDDEVEDWDDTQTST